MKERLIHHEVPRRPWQVAGAIMFQKKIQGILQKTEYRECIASSYHCQSNGHVEACTSFSKEMLRKCIDTNADPYIASLQIRSTPLGKGIPSPVTLLFNCHIRGTMLVISMPPVNTDIDDEHHKTLVQRQVNAYKNYDTVRNSNSVPVGSTVAVEREDGGLWTHGATVDKGDQYMMDHMEYK